MSFVTCNLCGADDYGVRFEAGVAQPARVVECNKCGLMYSNPRAAEPDHIIISTDENRAEGYRVERITKEALQVRDYKGTRAFLGERFPNRGRILDVGSGFGYLLDYFRQDGWQVAGVDPDEGLNRHAREKLGIDVITGLLSDANYAPASFEAVLMMHVIEHVPDPHGLLREIYGLLKPGGVLVMETPRYDTLMFKLFGRRERSLSCAGHIYFFTTRTLREVSEKAGFKVLRSDKVGRSLTLERLVTNVGIVTRSPKLRGALLKMARAVGMENASMHFNVRDMERIYLLKPE